MAASLRVSGIVESRLRNMMPACLALETPTECIVAWKLSRNDAEHFRRPEALVKPDLVYADNFEQIFLFLTVRGQTYAPFSLATLTRGLTEKLGLQEKLRVFILTDPLSLSDVVLVELDWDDAERRRARRMLNVVIEDAERAGLSLASFLSPHKELQATYELE